MNRREHDREEFISPSPWITQMTEQRRIFMASNGSSRRRLRLVAIVLGCIGLLGSTLRVPSEALVTTNITSTAGVGNLGTIVTPGGATTTITGGMRPGNGTNLFHSFGQFTIGTGDTANFFNETHLSTTNILSRVTGGNPSNIFGTIQTTGFPGANLFLINPAGVIFGPNATLNVEGSFHVTTADYLRLTDGVQFTAKPDVVKDSLLTTAPVAAFGFLTSSPASVSVQGSTLQVATGQTLSIIAGDINITSADTTDATPGAVLRAAHGQINIASVASSGEVIPNQPGFPPALDVSSFTTLGTITESNSSNITVSNVLGAGTILIRGGKLVVDSSFINANTTGAANGNPIGTDIQVTGDVLLLNGSQVPAFTSGAGNASSINVKADTVEISGGSFISSAVNSTGNGGNIRIDTNSLRILSGGYIFVSSGNMPGSTGRGGDLDVTAKDILIRGVLGQFTGLADQTGFGSNGGTVRITTDSLQLLDAGGISTTLYSIGHGANLEITAKNVLISGVLFDDSQNPPDFHASIDARVIGPFASGVGGDIKMNVADSLIITNGGFIGSGLFSGAPGNAGNIQINAKTLKLTERGQIFATSFFGTGNAGNIDVTANNMLIAGVSTSTTPLSVFDFTGVSNSTGDGMGGHLRISAQDFLMSSQAAIASATGGPGPGGTIMIDAQTIGLNTGAIITASSFGTGNAGSISITAADRFQMRDSIVTTQATQADGGNITIRAGEAVQLIHSSITTSVGTGSGNGGNITIDPQFVILQSGSQILANAFGGNGGNINIAAGLLLVSPDSVINASSALGVAGTITVNSAITDLSGSLTPLPQGFLRTGVMLSSRCAAQGGGSHSSFVVAGREAIPMEPGGLLPSPISEPGTIGVAELAPGERTMVALNLAAESLDGGCRQ
jgi:filamentous hemagglutinin family protein